MSPILVNRSEDDGENETLVKSRIEAIEASQAGAGPSLALKLPTVSTTGLPRTPVPPEQLLPEEPFTPKTDDIVAANFSSDGSSSTKQSTISADDDLESETDSDADQRYN